LSTIHFILINLINLINTTDKTELQAWNGRVVLMDVLFYLEN
jgi:hypothetical protein